MCFRRNYRGALILRSSAVLKNSWLRRYIYIHTKYKIHKLQNTNLFELVYINQLLHLIQFWLFSKSYDKRFAYCLKSILSSIKWLYEMCKWNVVGSMFDNNSDSLHEKWNFPLSISSVNVTKSARNREFGHIYWRNP